MRTVLFIDTSILCNLLDLPGMAQDRIEVAAEYRAHVEAGAQFVLPISTVIETGNHIEQIASGHERRIRAEQFDQILREIATDTAPWVLHAHEWDAAFLSTFCDGGPTSPPFVEVASTGTLGGGDVSILVERDRYRARVSTRDVRIWTKDTALAAYS
jgi:hypothetical protein